MTNTLRKYCADRHRNELQSRARRAIFAPTAHLVRAREECAESSVSNISSLSHSTLKRAAQMLHSRHPQEGTGGDAKSNLATQSACVTAVFCRELTKTSGQRAVLVLYALAHARLPSPLHAGRRIRPALIPRTGSTEGDLGRAD